MDDIRRFRRATPVDLRVAARPVSVVRVRHALVAYAASLGAAAQLQAAIALTATEATSNAVLHAYVDREPGHIHVTAEQQGGRLVITIGDDGRGMRPRTDSPGLGMGLALMASLADGCEVQEPADGQGTCVTLQFDLGSGETAATPLSLKSGPERPSSIRPDLDAQAAGPSIE
jgi:anti-sigma regulatory factor (Ser/Thr protein kinase)